MPRLLRSCRLFWIAPALAIAVLPAAAQNQHDMTFHTVPPCTVVDTRIAGSAFAANETRTYNVAGSGSLASQGGSATGCGVPGFSNGIAQVQAVALNIVAGTPTGPGNIAANAADQALAGSVVNFTANQNTSNTTPVAVAQATGVGDFKIQVNISSAHVVIRVFGYYSKPVQTVYVHPVPGDQAASGTALLNAMSGITNASATKHYVIKLEPGTYDLGITMLQMKPYVDIEGSGQQATVIQGQGNNDLNFSTGIIEGASSSELRSLQVKSTGSASFPISIGVVVPSGRDTRIKDVTVVSTGPDFNAGIRARDVANPVIEDVTVSIQGGTNGYGITAAGADPFIERAKLSVTDSTNGHGLFLFWAGGGSLINLRDLQITVTGGSGGYGIRVVGSGTNVALTNSKIVVQGSTSASFGINSPYGVRVEQSQIRASSSGNSYGLSGGLFTVNHSEITAGTGTVNQGFIGATQLNGGPAGGTCAGVYDESFTFFAGPACP